MMILEKFFLRYKVVERGSTCYPYQGWPHLYFQFFQHLYHRKINQKNSKDQKYDNLNPNHNEKLSSCD